MFYSVDPPSKHQEFTALWTFSNIQNKEAIQKPHHKLSASGATDLSGKGTGSMRKNVSDNGHISGSSAGVYHALPPSNRPPERSPTYQPNTVRHPPLTTALAEMEMSF